MLKTIEELERRETIGFVLDAIQALIAIAIIVALASCAPKTVPADPAATAHPGSLNALDSKTYDALTIAQGIIRQGQKDRAAASLPGPLQSALTALEKGYGIARLDWLAWRSAMQAASTPAATRDILANAMMKSQGDLANSILGWNNAKASFPGLIKE